MNDKISRRTAFTFLATVMTPMAWSESAWGQSSYQQISLKQQLQFGLRARTPQEFAYIDTIVDLVERKILPRDLVNMAFLWARKKGRYPYPYFSRALVILAERDGIVIPPGPY